MSYISSMSKQDITKARIIIDLLYLDYHIHKKEVDSIHSELLNF